MITVFIFSFSSPDLNIGQLALHCSGTLIAHSSLAPNQDVFSGKISTSFLAAALLLPDKESLVPFLERRKPAKETSEVTEQCSIALERKGQGKYLNELGCATLSGKRLHHELQSKSGLSMLK